MVCELTKIKQPELQRNICLQAVRVVLRMLKTDGYGDFCRLFILSDHKNPVLSANVGIQVFSGLTLQDAIKNQISQRFGLILFRRSNTFLLLPT